MSQLDLTSDQLFALRERFRDTAAANSNPAVRQAWNEAADMIFQRQIEASDERVAKQRDKRARQAAALGISFPS